MIKPVSVTRECVFIIECSCGHSFKEDGDASGDAPDSCECTSCGAMIDLTNLWEEEPGIGVPE